MNHGYGDPLSDTDGDLISASKHTLHHIIYDQGRR
jgi:hypothetical protein